MKSEILAVLVASEKMFDRRFFPKGPYEKSYMHDDGMPQNAFLITGPLLWNSSSHRWIPLTKGS